MKGLIIMNNTEFGNHSYRSPFFRLLQAAPEGVDSTQAVLLVVSAKGLQNSSGCSLSVKKIDLKNIEKIAKLDQYHKENRLIFAIEKADQIYINISGTMAKALESQGRRLMMNGKEMTRVEVMSQEEYLEEFSEIIEIFKKILRPVQNKERKTPRTDCLSKEIFSQASLRISSDIQILNLLFRIKSIPNKIKCKIIQCMLENQRQIEQRRVEQSKKDRIKTLDIKESEIKKAVLKDEIRKQSIKNV